MGPQYFSNGHDFGHHGKFKHANSSIENSGIVGVMGYLEGTRACLESTKSGNDSSKSSLTIASYIEPCFLITFVYL
ncbi:hypothetical protein Hdeb2414_s0006g00188631 [Helianthus debilis subsp. tardiflorus]